MKERRNFSRVDFRVSALLQAEGVAVKGEVTDVSLHGLYMETQELIPVGTPVEVTIYLSAAPDPVVINVKGTVARLVPGGLGCAFDKMDVESFAHLRSIISYQGGDESKVMAEFSEYVVKKMHDE
ncbi:PilZ domain-containing protein [Geomonas sp. Red69]|uniref:PilZ domain-containing protein n=1 Tax=Geomonas diazotrophica TaxID=2843197 RepID=A0ABX8JG82_9BACT|nr:MULTISPECIES: PilZ domain-containing protein [Geomonas]MBU5638787.1 PilZ domain-containing protein [Geomonas diazotrophica]QWV96584.1 PilZ domain-containing protein [Geomonas nitrogeniifigens]QXE85686.1 PilZ domain-containing protein [Geomonas nitrogeniifigens]